MKISKPKNLTELLREMAEAKAKGAKVKFVNAETGEESDDPPPELKVLETMMGDHEGCGDPECGACNDPAPERNKASPELAARLMEIAAIHASPPHFSIGQFVRYRKDTEIVKRGQGLHIVVDNIDPPFIPDRDAESASGSPVAYRRYDVVIATGSSETGVCKYLADSRELELYPDADKLMKSHS